MIGAIAGDIIGSIYEGNRIKTKDFPLFVPGGRFTDDTVLTVAIAQAILKGGDYTAALKNIGRNYPLCGYGGAFSQWLFSRNSGPYYSWGNGSAMRVSPVGFAFNTRETVLEEAIKTAEVTHSHPEGIKGAQAVALAVFLATNGSSKENIRSDVQQSSRYDLQRTIEEIRPAYSFDVSCQGSVPESIIAFLDSASFEDAVRNAVSLGGDSDTMACIAGAIAEAYYGGVPVDIVRTVRTILPDDLWNIVKAFCRKYYDTSIRELSSAM